MKKRRRSGGGLSKNPRRRERQLANLKPGNVTGSAAGPGNTRSLKHGARATIPRDQLDDEVAEIYRALAESAPVRDPDGGLPQADEAAVEVAARALKRWRGVVAYCDAYGRFEESTGALKPAAEYELSTERALKDALADLGLDPAARLKMGLDLQRSVALDLAAYWQAEDESTRNHGDAIEGDADAPKYPSTSGDSIDAEAEEEGEE